MILPLRLVLATVSDALFLFSVALETAANGLEALSDEVNDLIENHDVRAGLLQQADDWEGR